MTPALTSVGRCARRARLLKTSPMAGSGRAPRIWIDVEHGAAFGDAGGTLEVFEVFTAVTRPVREVWLFHRHTGPLLRGFYYPRSLNGRFGVPNGRGPSMVLIDEHGDQLWFSGASCGSHPGAAGAILAALGITKIGESPSSEGLLSQFDELHLVDGRVVGHRLVGEHTPSSPPGRTFVRNGRIINRMEFDKGGVGPTDLRELWAMATQAHGWLGSPTALALFDDRLRSERSGHDGCRLIATGESGRELWLQLPEPDEFHRIAAGRRRHTFEGAISEYESATRWIFRSVGAVIDPPNERTLRDTLLGRHPVPPAVVRWP